ncbi:MAG TPA: hypothetical protein VGG10_19515 [Rhizomicrobium sp.]|jgi:hypothetical protein
MLHSFTIALGVIALLGGLIALAFGGFPPAFIFLFWGVVLLIGTLFERYRYKPVETATPVGNWTRTPERFLDEHGRPITVWLDPATGERKYVAD